jgi:hypothetical protein
MTSATITAEEQVLMLPMLSVNVRVALFGPMLEQVNNGGVTTRFKMRQLSVLLLSNIEWVMFTLPESSSCTDTESIQRAMGPTLSAIETVLEQELLLPDASVAIKTTVLLLPILAQVKMLWLRLIVMPQLSELPALTIPTLICATPAESRLANINPVHLAIGATVSRAHICELHVEEFEFVSETVNTIVFNPILLHLSWLGFTVRLAMPQASKLLLSIREGKMENWPLLSRNIVSELMHCATGRMVSETCTFDWQEAELPWTSVTVRITALSPTLRQEKFCGLTLIVAIPQTSELLEFIAEGDIEAIPALFRKTVTEATHNGTGGTVSNTATLVIQELVLPAASVSVIVTLFGKPTCVQLNALGFSTLLMIPQLSLLELSTVNAEMDPAPTLFR